MVHRDPVLLASDSPGCALEATPRRVQNGNIYYVSLNPDWLSQLGIADQGAPTAHSLATRPVEVREPAIIIQSAELVLDG